MFAAISDPLAQELGGGCPFAEATAAIEGCQKPALTCEFDVDRSAAPGRGSG